MAWYEYRTLVSMPVPPRQCWSTSDLSARPNTSDTTNTTSARSSQSHQILYHDHLMWG